MKAQLGEQARFADALSASAGLVNARPWMAGLGAWKQECSAMDGTTMDQENLKC
ncbi:MAG: hypothetical protein JSS25_06140 [Proteobacteria bacterium]|nr:hypothetical protein [Pseudomonadota bacterium]